MIQTNIDTLSKKVKTIEVKIDKADALSPVLIETHIDQPTHMNLPHDNITDYLPPVSENDKSNRQTRREADPTQPAKCNRTVVDNTEQLSWVSLVCLSVAIPAGLYILVRSLKDV